MLTVLFTIAVSNTPTLAKNNQKDAVLFTEKTFEQKQINHNHQALNNYSKNLEISVVEPWVMRLPEKLLVEHNNNHHYQLNIDESSTNLTVNLFFCETQSADCLQGSFSVNNPNLPEVQQALEKHKLAASPITLSPHIQGYFLTEDNNASIMWEQDNLIYQIDFTPSEKQNILYMAYSMANSNPLTSTDDLTTKIEFLENSLNEQENLAFRDNSPQLSSSTENTLRSPEQVLIQGFEFEGNTAFSEQELNNIISEFTNREITFNDLITIEEKIRQMYHQGCNNDSLSTQPCYRNSDVIIPEGQNLTEQNGIVKIEIIEGGIEEIRVIGTERLDPNYIRSRLASATQTPVDQKKILTALQLLQLNPLIESITTELSAGTRQNQSILEVRVKEANSLNLGLFLDNGRAPSVGSIRRGINFNQANLLGFGDSLNLTFTNTDGSNAINTNYTFPINAQNGTINLSGGVTETSVIEAPFDLIDIKGDSYFVELGYRQPLILTPAEELAFGLKFTRQESQTSLLGFNFPLSLGADENGETRISSIRFSQDYTQRNPDAILAFYSQFSLGLDLFNSTLNSQLPDSRFIAWRGQSQYVRRLAENTLLFVRGDVQLSTDALVPLEQFSLGGLQSVRGYRQDLFLTDNGFFVSGEVRLPVLEIKEVEGLLQVIPFVDFGIGWNSSNIPEPEQNSLLGLGLGVQWTMGDRFNARLDWGYPLIDVKSTENTLQENGIYFSIESNLF